MKNFVLTVVFTAIILSLNSCVSFSRKMIQDDLLELKDENVQMINGQYGYKGYEHIRNGNVKSDKTRNVGEMLDVKSEAVKNVDKLIIKSMPLAKSKMYEIQFMLLKEDTLKYTFTYKARLKNGLFLLKNFTSHCDEIPYLFGGCRIFQSRIGLTKDHNLLIQDYYDNSGAFLFFFWAGYTINYAEKYKRIH
ncbi:hypothetical protein [Chryseobacterium jejuense]|uniref:Uncharacterized protein n=1 Tax=Chryseobacterium jejuense TaxID=445960 RepID=A0A2X2X6Q8_CHRJE|nr:hypothetical protein [Chryseobacterium jejuense]SDJ36541.1 hypothetical protein SAMN05421542_3320 [Chryseobacterium jejuense]SQB45823.1 Uncharacterised protein [Chryseobacterium jejuense]